MITKEVYLIHFVKNRKLEPVDIRFVINILSCFLILLMLASCNAIHKSKDKETINQPFVDKQYKFSIDDGTIFLLYKLQKQIASSTSDSLLLRKMVIDSIYMPHERLFTYCLGYEKAAFADKYTSALLLKSDSIIKLVQNYEVINLDEVIIKTIEEIAQKSDYPLEGKYVIGFFEDAGCIMCGCDNNTMLGNTYNASYKNPDVLKVVIAHEINHNFFETAKKDDPDKHTVLYNSIDEGFANLFSMKAMNVDKLMAFNMSEEEYKWLEDNEIKLKEKFRKVMFSTKEEDWDPYSEKIPNRIIEGSPGDIGYFLGFRIIEEWLEKDDSRKWQDVYTTAVRRILLESDYFN